MVRTSLAVFSAMLLISVSSPSFAQNNIPCENRDKIAQTLKKDYSEVPVSVGLDNAGRMIEVFASTKGSWTMLMTMPSGVSCLMATGNSWTERDIEKRADRGIPL